MAMSRKKSVMNSNAPGPDLGPDPGPASPGATDQPSPVMVDPSLLPVFPAPQALLRLLQIDRASLAEEWLNRLINLSPLYRKRPREELVETVAEAYAAFEEVLEFGRFARIENFIDFITNLRLEADFPLSDVQKAFELFRSIVVRRLTVAKQYRLLAQSQESLNTCLAYTIYQFSDHFQRHHEQTLREHARNLEQEIALRTAQLTKSERRYKALVEEINDGYFVLKDQIIIFANQGFCHMHRTSLAQVLGQSFLSFIVPDDRERLLAAYNQVHDGQPSEGQTQYIRMGPPPERAATEVKARQVDWGEGPMLIGLLRDISDRVFMENQMREHERLAYLGRLSASLSHEIRNPLSAMKMNLQILARKLELDGYDQRRLEITAHQVSRLEDILRTLLDTARPVTIDLAPVNLAALAQGCVYLLEVKAQEKKLIIEQKHPRWLPLLELDAGKMEQALINLLLNAMEASPEGGRITLWTKAGRGPNRYLEVGVRDCGPGIGRQERLQIFTPFYSGRSQGVGLGLSNVKRIVEAHSGRIEVRGRPGRGAAFILRFPWPK